MNRNRIGPYTASRVYCGDARELGKVIPDNSIDLIFTDPPYAREFTHLYGWLAETARRVLKPGGFCLAMSGNLYADEIMWNMAKHLKYYFTFHVRMNGNRTGKVHPHGNKNPIILRMKPIYAFVKGKGMPRTVMYDPFEVSQPSKEYHHWGQDLQSARYYIDCFSRVRDVVFDPFVGGGTTAVVAKRLRRRFLAFEMDEMSAEISRGRVRNECYTPNTNGQMVLPFAV